MTFSELEKQAKTREPMPDGLTQSEQKAYQSIALLTERYLLGKISAEAAKSAMRNIRVAFQSDSGRDSYIQHCAELWRNIESAAREFAKERTVEAAERMYAVIYNTKLSERKDDDT